MQTWQSNGWPFFSHQIHQSTLPREAPAIASWLSQKDILLPIFGKKTRSQFIYLFASPWMKSCTSLLEKALDLSKSVEFLHFASLIHDDVLDQSLSRRQGPSLNQSFGNRQAILQGDFWFLLALEKILKINYPLIQKEFIHLAKSMLQGQMQEFFDPFEKTHLNPKKTLLFFKKKYMIQASQKTALLFAYSAWASSVLRQSSILACQEAYRCGYQVGLAYQLLDDAQDYLLPLDQWKSGHDYLEKKWTFPILLAIENKKLSWNWDDPLETPCPPFFIEALRQASSETHAVAHNWLSSAKLSFSSWLRLSDFSQEDQKDFILLWDEFIHTLWKSFPLNE